MKPWLNFLQSGWFLTLHLDLVRFKHYNYYHYFLVAGGFCKIAM